MSELFGEVISTYTRGQAIEDGMLIDVSETAREAGITFPVAITAGLWADYIEPSKKDQDAGQSIQGRLWDVLWMLRCACKGVPSVVTKKYAYGMGQAVHYKCAFYNKGRTKEHELKAIVGPGDDMEPTITVMKVDED